MLAGITFAIVGSLAVGLGNTYSVLLTGEILIAISVSLRSGTDSAFLFELSASSIDVYKKLEGLSVAARYIALCSGSLAGSVLFDINKTLPFIISAFMFGISFFFAVLIPNEGKSFRKMKGQRINLNKFKRFFELKDLLPLILLAASVGAFFSVTYWLIQPYLQSIKIAEKFFGVIYTLSFILSAVGAFISGRIRFDKASNYSQIILLGAAGASVLLALYFVRNKFGIIFILLNQFFIGFSYPVIFSTIQKEVTYNFRATVLSAESLLQRLFLTSMIFIISTVISNKGLYGSLLVTDFILVGIFGISLLIVRLNAKSR